MSADLAYAPLPAARPHEHPRHVEIVTTAVQRGARPKMAYAMVGVGGLAAIFLAQLLLSIALSDGAYRISGLEGEKRDLGRTEQSLIEQLELSGSSQSLAATAEGLGMVTSRSPMYLRLSDGQVLGSVAASTGTAGTSGLVPNSLLADSAQPFSGVTTSATSTASAPASPPGVIPSPVTR